jgi:GNAT superfamily N-acetyltransferase
VPNNLPTRQELADSYNNNWTLQGHRFELTGKYHTGEDAGNYSSDGPPYLSKQCVLVYEATIMSADDKPVLAKNAGLFWYDDVKNPYVEGRVAYLFLLEVLADFRGRGIGTAYATVQEVTLPSYSVKAIFLKASHYGPRFWSKMGYTLIDSERFLMDYQEYCDGNDLDYCETIKIEEMTEEYLEFLRESRIDYPMIKKLTD